ncbi:PRC-barrel domain-containing protein [Streptomyces sp. NPDC087300]|uniref:PRC-barrel domain-containing protein n=1 Tax=Streptomyces sp. NPDC087300 TaxID=3365780 RepID=UPI0038070B80
MLFSRTLGCPVLSASDASRVGTVAGLVVDPEHASISALRLTGVSSGGDVIPWSDVHAVGPDAVVVEALAAARFTSAAAPEVHNPLGKRLLTELGDLVGTVRDIAFDPESGAVGTLHTSRGEQVPGSGLLGLGSYAVVIRVVPGGGAHGITG